uniref:UDENN domain-containing protein n=1 Tax=Mesocestoides corti TaxID=53468 RepID=A0A5K3FY87_MESCO
MHRNAFDFAPLLAGNSNSNSAHPISLKCCRVISVQGSPQEEVMLKPFSGCLIEQVSLHLLHGIAPEAVSYVSEVVLPPNSTGNRFAFGLVPPRTISEIESEKWRLCALSYRLITFGGFRVNLPLAITNKSSSTLNTSSLQLSNSSTWSDDGDPSKVGPAIHVAGDVLPPIRMCPPLPRLCILVGPSTHEKVEPASLCRGLILDNLAGRLPSFSPTVQLASTSHNQDTRHNLCDIVIDLHPFETRWLPIQLFVVENACPCEEVISFDRPLPSHQDQETPQSLLNLLHISLQKTLTTNKFLQAHSLLMGQFLQILGVHEIRQK